MVRQSIYSAEGGIVCCKTMGQANNSYCHIVLVWIKRKGSLFVFFRTNNYLFSISLHNLSNGLFYRIKDIFLLNAAVDTKKSCVNYLISLVFNTDFMLLNTICWHCLQVCIFSFFLFFFNLVNLLMNYCSACFCPFS